MISSEQFDMKDIEEKRSSINDRYRQLSSVAISSKPTAVLDFVLPLDRWASPTAHDTTMMKTNL